MKLRKCLVAKSGMNVQPRSEMTKLLEPMVVREELVLASYIEVGINNSPSIYINIADPQHIDQPLQTFRNGHLKGSQCYDTH